MPVVTQASAPVAVWPDAELERPSIAVPEPLRAAPAASPIKFGRLLALLVIYGLIAHVWPAPAGITPAAWRITAVFLTTIAGLMLQPMPGAALVVVGLTGLVIAGGVPVTRA